jgi:hypothetical protein
LAQKGKSLAKRGRAAAEDLEGTLQEWSKAARCRSDWPNPFPLIASFGKQVIAVCVAWASLVDSSEFGCYT